MASTNYKHCIPSFTILHRKKLSGACPGTNPLTDKGVFLRVYPRPPQIRVRFMCDIMNICNVRAELT